MRSTIRELSRPENRLSPWQRDPKHGKILWGHEESARTSSPQPVRFAVKENEPEERRSDSGGGEQKGASPQAGGLRLKQDASAAQPQASAAAARTLTCPKCGHKNDSYALRCDSCGKLLDAGPPQEEAQPSAPPAALEATVRDAIIVCRGCGAVVTPGASSCPHCGTMVGKKKKIAVYRNPSSEGYLGVIALVIAFIGLAVFKLTGIKVASLAVGIVGIAAGVIALNKDQQPGLGLAAMAVGILDIFLSIVAPVF